MRLKSFYLCGALAVAAIPLSAGAQSWPANNPSAPNAQGYTESAKACPPGYDFEPSGYLGNAGRKAAPRYPARDAGSVKLKEIGRPTSRVSASDRD